MAEHNERGRWGEQVAAEYLERKGFRILDRDWRAGHRDLDIIAIDSDELVIVEVKTRKNNYFVEPETAVNVKKIRNICIAASIYVKMNRIDLPIRFDIVAITGTADTDYSINHIERAFLPIPYYRH